ncbi:MAG TPA: UvrB/UvrC motif-containing protein, partial [Chloroflexota bacterium]|nr:UvrB/UvrC motif-containing protein [Chloroflexota bacterium]
EGLDLPEVSLVAILDADKEGFLRAEGSLIQTIGRAARHINANVIMYADTTTTSMQRAIDETYRRRKIQMAYNEEHGIDPVGISKAIRDIGGQLRAVAERKASYVTEGIPKDEIARLIKDLERQMKDASKNLEFEKAALLRDQIVELRRNELTATVDPTHDPLVTGKDERADAVSIAERILAEQAAAAGSKPRRRSGRYRH